MKRLPSLRKPGQSLVLQPKPALFYIDILPYFVGDGQAKGCALPTPCVSSQGKSWTGFFPLTLVADVKAVDNLASTYARDLAAILKGVRDPGQAIIADDTAERAVVGRVIR